MTNESNPAPHGPQPEQTPPRVAVRIRAAPKLRQIYWCDFPRDAQLPEMWKTRPVVVVSYKNTLTGHCLVVPTSTSPQGNNPWACQLTAHIAGRENWAICNQPYTVANSRLSQTHGTIPLVSKAEFNEIIQRLTAWLPRPFDLDKSE